MKKVVYTALFGNYKLYNPEYIDPTWKYICFTDQDINSECWQIKKIDTSDQRKKSREVKIKSHEFLDYDICLYIDCKFKISIKNNLDRFAENLKNDLCLMIHNKRTCLYDEGNFCIQKKKDKKEVILQQLNYYRQQGMPEKYGLYAPGIMLKRNTKTVNNFMNLWYDEVDKYSYRDIISFPYVLWKNPIKLSLMPFKKTYFQFRRPVSGGVSHG